MYLKHDRLLEIALLFVVSGCVCMRILEACVHIPCVCARMFLPRNPNLGFFMFSLFYFVFTHLFSFYLV